MSVAEHLAQVRENIAAAARRAGREPSAITLVAVSKTHPAQAVLEAMAQGQMVFGENYVQECQEKIPQVGPGPQWHFIGHLQSNKAATAVRLCHVVQTVDRAKLARTLDRHAAEAGKRLGVMVQVNVGGEAQKSGCEPEEAAALCAVCAESPHLELLGLMTMPPFFDQPERVRPIFARLRELAHRLAADLPPGAMAQLSMGMSGDYEAAIAEGATHVRVGTAIFGARDYAR